MSIRLDTLSNGMRVVTERMPGLGSAAVGVWVNAGARHERPEQNGIAHFLEHMAFKGTERRTALQIAEAIEDVGGYINAYTSKEMTAYYTKVLEADVALALDVLFDILLNPAFDPKEIDVERGVILQEIGQSLDTPDDVVFDWLQEVSYPEQAMGRTILGTQDRVSGFSRDDFSAFVGEHYSPDQLVVSAAGAVDHDQIVRMAEESFGGLSSRPVPGAEPARFSGGSRVEAKPLEQAHFAMALEGPSVLDSRFYASRLYGIMMGGGMSSRLFQEIREKRGLCYTIFANMSSYRDSGSMVIYSGTSREDLASLVDITVSEMRRAADDLGQRELDRAVTQLRAGTVMSLESPRNRMERMARKLLVWGEVPTPEEDIAKIEAVTLGEVKALARELCGSGQVALSAIGPVEGAPESEEVAAKLAA